MKIQSVIANARKDAFEIVLEGADYEVPYGKLRVVPSTQNPVVEVKPDPDLSNEAFTYRLESGDEDTVHADAVLEINEDPEHLQKLLIHKLTVAARDAVARRGLGKRQLARQLGTSASQLYRILDPEKHNKSLGQLLAVLLQAELSVDLVVRNRSEAPPAQTSHFEVFRAVDGSFHFNLKADDGRGLLRSHAYSTKRSCLDGIRSLRNALAHSDRHVALDNELCRIAVKAMNHRVLATSRRFENRAALEEAAAKIRAEGATAPVNRIREFV